MSTPPKKQKEKTLSFWESLIAGGVAGAVAKTAIAPLDRQKIIYQVTDKKFSMSNAFREMQITYRTEGVKALFRGNSAMMVRIVPYAAIKYMAFEHSKKIVIEMRHHDLSPSDRFLCGAWAGAVSQAVTYPLDLMRARLAYKDQHTGLLGLIVRSVREEGLKSLFQGLKPTLLGQIPYAGISFATFESLKVTFANPKGEITTPVRFVLGAFAGLLAQSVTYPLDVVRRRMQIDSAIHPRYKGVTDALITIYRNEGLQNGLYKGLSMNWIKGPIAVGISFTVFDYLKTHLIRNRHFTHLS